MRIVWRKIWRDLTHNKARTLMVVLSALASLWPALRATQVSVRESLACE